MYRAVIDYSSLIHYPWVQSPLSLQIFFLRVTWHLKIRWHIKKRKKKWNLKLNIFTYGEKWWKTVLDRNTLRTSNQASKVCHNAIFNTKWWFTHETFPSEFVSFIRIFDLWLQILRMIKNSKLSRFSERYIWTCRFVKIIQMFCLTLQLTHYFWNYPFFHGVMYLKLKWEFTVRIYQEATL